MTNEESVAKMFEVIQYTPMPLGNMNVKTTDIMGIMSIVQPCPGAFAAEGFVFFCCSCMMKELPRDVRPARIGIAQ